MTGKNLLRLFGALVCLATVVTGWDAEAGWRNRRCCCDSCCYDPCCRPVCEPACAPACCTTVATCCTPSSYTIFREAVIAPASCCASSTIVKEPAAAAPADQPAVKLTSARR